MILLLALAWQVGLAAAVPALIRPLGRDVGYLLAVGYLAGAALLLSHLPTILRDEAVEVSWRWLPAMDISVAFRMDALALIFALLVLAVGALIMMYTPRYLSASGRHATLYVTLTLFAAAMLGLVLANDLLVLFVFWELTSILSFVLIGRNQPSATRPAAHALLVTSGGGLALLAGFVVLMVSLGTSDLTRILAEPDRVASGPAAAAGALILVGVFTKSAQMPFHFWLPGAMIAITPVSAYLHAATMVKAGIYLAMRFSALFGGYWPWRVTLVGVGLVTAVLGAFLALRQYDLKAMLAYSTVSQLGLLIGVIGVGTPESDAAAILYTAAHALFKATLFMLVGIIDHEAGSRDLRELSGLRRKMPVTTMITALAAMSLAGLPPTIGFVGKEAIFEAFGKAPGISWPAWTAVGLAVLASVLTFAYAARLVHGLFAGPSRQRALYEPSWSFLAPAAVAAVAATAAGPLVGLISPLVVRAANNARPQGEPADLAFWHGVTVALLLSVLTFVLGTVIFALRRRVDRRLLRTPTPRPFGWQFDRGYQWLLRVGEWVAAPARSSRVGPFLAVPLLVVIALGAAGLALAGPLPASTGDLTQFGDVVVLALLVLVTAGLVGARSVLAAISLTGVVGLILSAWFVTLGAPDVAVTLLLVEVLTTIVMMLALRRRPRELHRPRLRGSAGAAALAVGVGVVAAAATAALTGRRETSPPGRYYLERAEEITGGHNVVNVILVDFRALDTLGEAVVLTVVALGLAALLRLGPPALRAGSAPPHPDLVFCFAYRVLTPVMLVVSAYLFARGHEEVGGGFIGALVAGTAVGLGHIAHAGSASPPLGWLRARPLLVSGLLLSLVVGLAPMASGRPILSPGTLPLPGPLSLSSATLFDLGVYLMVLALAVSAVRRLGASMVDSRAAGAEP
ncbi:hydrogen gas-evolving membrane-bound hydrogenase subunit E [Micromonospora sp. CNB394]|uniref:hydrogen gas-evolving membrane-bound hydrogenase subunit E n=1 Tax=Micromonospora sp. CNB394 TaxID=1169151 RepID=UPI00037D5238|nr:hydrogen gas-evolving membrane-bound hydrogenase subunit E [Micromonospora sp. CNB394]